MISREAINAYLNAKYDSHLWMKSLSEEVLDQFIDEMQPKPDLRRFPLRKHQKVGFILGVAYPEFYLHYDMGLGKCMLSLALLNYFIRIGRIRKAIVLAPTDEICDTWEEEIHKWNFPDPYILLKGSTETKWEWYEGLEEGVAIASYPGLVWMLCEKEMKKGRGKKHNELVPKKDLVSRFNRNIDAVIFDEITKCGNNGSLTFRLCNQISKVASYRYGLSGRAFGRDPMVAWAQFGLTDRGLTFHKNKGFFQEVFFESKKKFWGGPYSKEYKFNKKREGDFGRIMQHRSIRYSSDECLDLPALVADRKYVVLPSTSSVYYRKAVEELKKSRGNLRECKNAFIRMRQISSGFIGFIDDDTGERAQLEFEENPKLDLLLDLIEQVPDNRKFVICVDFIYSGLRISKALRGMKIQHGFLWSGTKDWPSLKSRFDNAEDFRGLIVQSQKGSYGLNLQAANYSFVYESPISVEVREQYNRRLRRQGQKHTVFQYDLIMRNTADEAILRFHAEGRNLYKSLVIDPESVVK